VVRSDGSTVLFSIETYPRYAEAPGWETGAETHEASRIDVRFARSAPSSVVAPVSLRLHAKHAVPRAASLSGERSLDIVATNRMQNSPRRVLLVTLAVKGRLHPFVAVAEHLVARGHEVVWATPWDDVCGVDWVRGVSLGNEAPPGLLSGDDVAEQMSDEDSVFRTYRALLVEDTPGAVAAIRRVIVDIAPDVIVTDTMMDQALIAAELEKIRCVGISTGLKLFDPPHIDLAFRSITHRLESDRVAAFHAFGLSPPQFRLGEWISPWLTIVFSTRGLLGDAAIPPRTILVGPSIPSRPRGDEAAFPFEHLSSTRPLVYCSFGSLLSRQPDLWRTLFVALRPLDVQLVASMGPLSSGPELAKLARNDWILVPYAPQLRLLPRAKIFVTHAGANSVMEALHFGVPMVAIPIGHDQPIAAHYLTKTRAGTVVARDRATPDRLREVIGGLLDDPISLVPGLSSVHRSYREQDGGSLAADAILRTCDSDVV
jgi:zeaxanthin glucosyltransferase